MSQGAAVTYEEGYHWAVLFDTMLGLPSASQVAGCTWLHACHVLRQPQGSHASLPLMKDRSYMVAVLLLL
jgi:hypothetical protein